MKMKRERGFIQILLLVIAIASIAGVGFVLRKQEKIAFDIPNVSNTANISEALKEVEDNVIIKEESEPEPEESQSKESLEQTQIENSQEVDIKQESIKEKSEETDLRLETKLELLPEVEFEFEPVAEIELEQQEQEQEKIKENPIQGYSKLNPAPLLMPITVKGEYDSHIYKWKITLLEFIRGSQALANMQAEYKTQNQPQYLYEELENIAPGYEYLLVKIKAECVQGFIFDETVISKPRCDAGMRFGGGFVIVAPDTKEFSTISQILYGLNLGEPSEEGYSSVDWLAFRVPVDDNLLLRYIEMLNEDFTDSIAWFQVY